MDTTLISKKLREILTDDKIFINEPMYKHTTFRVGGIADIYITPDKIDDIQLILKIVKDYNIPLTVIGNGSNLLVKDNGIRGIVLRPNLTDYEIVKKEDYAIACVGAGMLNGQLSQILAKEELEGFEFASGIPGTIGGGIYMNAGAFKKEFKDIVVETTYIDIESGNIKTITNEDHEFSYRNSVFMKNKGIILSSKLKFLYGNKEEILEKLKANVEYRVSTQPLNKPSAGSTFKRGNDYISAKIIDECGLKGKTIGDAQISPKHAGFVVNNGNAKASDIIELINLTKKTVLEQKGKELKLEIEIIGE